MKLPKPTRNRPPVVHNCDQIERVLAYDSLSIRVIEVKTSTQIDAPLPASTA